MKIYVINGPNMNMLGIREPDIYQRQTYQELCDFLLSLQEKYSCQIEIFQSNHEGAIIDKIQDAYFNKVDAIIINPAAFTHYSYAIRDAILACSIRSIEVHLTDIDNRDEFRKTSVIKDIVEKRFYGNGFNSYLDAVEYLIRTNK